MSNIKYLARFTPEVWIHDEAVEVDPLGPQEWDCTAYAQQHMDYLIKLRRAQQHLDYLTRLGGHVSLDPPGVVDIYDVFKDDPAAPTWVRDWRGPFTIRVRRWNPRPGRGVVNPPSPLDEKQALAYASNILRTLSAQQDPELESGKLLYSALVRAARVLDDYAEDMED